MDQVIGFACEPRDCPTLDQSSAKFASVNYSLRGPFRAISQSPNRPLSNTFPFRFSWAQFSTTIGAIVSATWHIEIADFGASKKSGHSPVGDGWKSPIMAHTIVAQESNDGRELFRNREKPDAGATRVQSHTKCNLAGYARFARISRSAEVGVIVPGVIGTFSAERRLRLALATHAFSTLAGKLPTRGVGPSRSVLPRRIKGWKFIGPYFIAEFRVWGFYSFCRFLEITCYHCS